MFKKYIVLAAVCPALLASSFCLARTNSDGRDYGRDRDRGRNYNERNYDYDRSYDYNYNYSRNYQGRKNAAAYPDYVSNATYYGAGNYNYGYNYGSICNCPVNCGYNYNYYNQAPGATNYTKPVCQNQYCGANYSDYGVYRQAAYHSNANNCNCDCNNYRPY